MSDDTAPTAGGTVTMKDICEYVAEWWNESHDDKVTGPGVFTISPTGELWPVFELYEQAKAERARSGREVRP